MRKLNKIYKKKTQFINKNTTQKRSKVNNQSIETLSRVNLILKVNILLKILNKT